MGSEGFEHDTVCSLSPYHNIIEQAIEEKEKESPRKWIYRNEDESKRLAIKPLSDNKK